MNVFSLPLIMTTVRVVQFAFFVWLFTALENEEWPTVIVCLFGLFAIEIISLWVMHNMARAAAVERRKLEL